MEKKPSRDPWIHKNEFRFLSWGRTHVFFWCLVALLVLTVFGVRSVMRPDSPIQLFTFVVTEDTAPLPPNPWANEDLECLRKSLDLRIAERGIQSRAEVEKRLEDFLSRATPTPTGIFRKSRQRAVLFYISAHGVVDDEGKPHLLFSDSRMCNDHSADGDPKQSWLSVDDMLQRICNFERLKKTRKIVLLDANRSLENWSIGVIQNPFAQAVEDLIQKNAYPNLWVINSTSAGEVAYTAPERGGTVFGSFVTEGLAGQADANGDGEIYASEFENYVKRGVRDWVAVHRADVQIPLVIKSAESGGDMLIHKRSRSLSWSPVLPENRLAEIENAGKVVDVLWSRFNKLDYDRCVLTRPVELAEFHHDMSRLESLWQGGYYYLNSNNEGFTEAHTLADKSLVRLEKPCAETSLPLVGLTISGKSPAADDLAIAMRQVDEASKNPPAEKSGDEKNESAIQPSFHAVATAVWQKLRHQPSISAHDLSRYLDCVYKKDNQSQSNVLSEDVKELFLLRAMKEECDWNHKGMALLAPQAIRIFHEGELASRVEDLRVVPWIEQRIHGIDHQFRKNVFDNLFGNDSALAKAEEECNPGSEITQSLAALRTDIGEISAAYGFIDHVRLEFPWVAQFAIRNASFARSLKTGKPTSLAGEETSRTRNISSTDEDLEGIASILELYRKYHSRLVPHPDFRSEGFRFENQNSFPADAFRNFAEELAHSESLVTSANVRDALDVLQVPLKFSGRETLRRKLLSRFVSPEQEPPRNIRRNAINGLGTNHPLLLFFAYDHPREIKAENYAEWIGESSDAIRSKLSRIAQDISETYQREDTNMQRSDIDRLAESARESAGIAILPMNVRGVEAVQRQLDLNWRDYRVFQGERIVRDFWGKLDRDEYFFFAAGSRLEYPSAKLNQLKEIADNWTPLLGSSVAVDPSESKSQGEFQWSRTTGIPAGLATVRIGDARIPREVHGQSGNRDDITAAMTKDSVVGTVFYRGHRAQAQASTSVRVARQTIEFETPEPIATISVNDLPLRTVDVVFVVDCSYSMRAEDDGENRKDARIEVARAALDEVEARLVKLADGPSNMKCNVGFVLFGHRSGWKQDENKKWVPTDKNIVPGDDVQPFEILPFGRNNKNNFTRVRGELNAVGETPLYFAISEGLELFSKSTSAAERYLFVLTDGVNWVAPDKNYPLEKNRFNGKDAAQLKLPISSRGVNVYIYRIGSSPEAEKDRKRFEEMIGDLESGLGNVAKIDTLTSANIFDDRVEDVLNEAGASTVHIRSSRYTLESTVGITERVDVARDVTVSLKTTRQAFNSEPVAVEGGERFEFEVRDDQLALKVFNPTSRKFVDGGKSDKHHYWFRSDRAGDRVTILVAVLNSKGRGFTPRPKYLWAEVWSPDDPEARYYFCDRTFVAGCSVPVLRLVVSNWKYADQATVQVWLSNDTSKSRRMKLQNLKLDDVEVTESSDSHVRIVESRMPGNVKPLHLLLEPTPSKIVRKIFDIDGRVEHEFIYGNSINDSEVMVRVIDGHGQWESSGEMNLPLSPQ